MQRLIRLAILTAILLPLALASAEAQEPRFDTWFDNKTMRVDYFHTGGFGKEIFGLDRVVSDGPWAGSRTRLVDPTNLGKYLVEVIDHRSNRLLYSRGYASLFGEWETTAEAQKLHRTFHESVRFPWPKKTVQLVVKKRDDQNAFQQVWSTLIDPTSRFVNPADIKPIGKVWTLFENGPPSEKVDLLVLGDGYSASEIPKFHADAKKLVDALFATEPFKSRKKDFNVRAIDLPTSESGIHRPRELRNRRTPIGTQYNIFDSERYVLTLDNRAMRDVASGAPYEFVEILVNEKKYGGGGIFNDHATAAVGSGFADYLFIHELGHHFAALADEYYTSPVAYQTGGSEHPEPWEPNVTALHDPANIKWKHLVTSGTPLPTPWDKETFDKHSYAYQQKRREMLAAGATEEQMDQLFREVQAWDTQFLASQTHAGKVGAFEGAMYEAQGLYRPEIDCIMFTRDEVGFCRVCSEGIERIIDLYARP
ncbi:MAG TPA: IgA Peptidase M64 [Thermoanaerobaculia bacterium]|nr:IgA Peptidase M64 [Thermoanaerobaculia bacterium]